VDDPDLRAAIAELVDERTTVKLLGAYPALDQRWGRVQQRPVTLGFSDGNRAEVLAGISPADDLILESTSLLTPGHPVRVARSR
ncbi:MAG: hypothetical protein WD468_01520, partial [Pirellulales bacterium]